MLCGLQAYTSSKSSHLGPAAFLKQHSKIWDLVLPQEETVALLALADDDSWSNHAQKLEAVVSSGALGRRLFGFAVVQTLGESVAAIIKTHVDLMLANEIITQAVVIEAKRAATKEVLAMKNLDMLPEKRNITCRYRSFPMPLKITCVQDEISLTFACALKSQAADAGDLESVFAEEPHDVGNFDSDFKACFPEGSCMCLPMACIEIWV